MKNFKASTLMVLFILSVCSISYGQSDSQLEKMERNIQMGKSENIKTEIYFPYGNLDLKSVSTDLLCKGIYEYKYTEQKPEVSYSEISKSSQIGYLQIESEETRIKVIDEDTYRPSWTIELNEKIDNKVFVYMDAGEGSIDLEGSNLSEFFIDMKAGEMDINLRDTSVPKLHVDMSVGEVEIDLSGEWKNDLYAKIKGGVGELSLKVPSNVGVQIKIKGILGEVNIDGFEKRKGFYINDAFGKTEQTLNFDIKGGIGEIDVEMVD